MSRLWDNRLMKNRFGQVRSGSVSYTHLFQTFCGLSGIGDLIVTCASMHSRNRRAGILIGKGYTCLLYTSRCV